jgi:D-alanyl-D-alanine carboxypeptidase (penicillin-binding protein 5/6)
MFIDFCKSIIRLSFPSNLGMVMKLEYLLSFSISFNKKFLTFFVIVFLTVGFIFSQTIEGPDIRCEAAVILDATTGEVLYSKNPDKEIPPASLTKLMTIHLALEKVSRGEISLDENIDLPEESWWMNQPWGSSRMWLNEGQLVTLRELLLGLAVASGNDAAVATAFYASGSVEAFAEEMNREARALGLKKTRFVEPSGISEFNITTAMEYAQFCKAYINFHPEVLKELHSVKEFTYPTAKNYPKSWAVNNDDNTHRNNNTLLGTLGVDGLKTGYIDESGNNIALTAEQNGTRFIAVLLGFPTAQMRTDDGELLLSWAFDNYKTVKPAMDSFPAIQVWKAAADQAEIIPMDSLNFTARTNRGSPLNWTINIDEPIIAPLPAGAKVGDIVFYDSEGELHSVPMITKNAIDEGNIFKRIWHSIKLFFMK